MDPISLIGGAGNSLRTDEEIVQTKVLIIYVGGTIGMKEVDGALVPVPDYMSGLLKSLPMFYDKEAAEELNLKEDEFVLPVIDNLRVIYKLIEFDPLKDSSNLVISDWVDIVTVIKDNYTDYHGFVILHGTDTMAYTASALSFMLQNLAKPVFVTGAQVPLSKFRSDGIDNMLGSLYIAGKYDIPEAGLFFNNRLYRGNRVLKRSSEDLEAFASPNFPPLAEMNINAEVNWENIFRPKPPSTFSVSTSMNNNIGMLTFFPGITAATVKACLSDPVQGVVLRSYGAGNGPDQQKDIIQTIKDANNRGVIILNCTQCYEGAVSASYETGQALLEAGAIPGSDITPEAALTKLCYVLGKEDLTLEEQKDLIRCNLRGEITVEPTHDKGLSLEDNKFANTVIDSLRLTSGQEAKSVKRALFPAMIALAVANDDVKQLQHLQNCGGDLNAGDLDGKTPLVRAASKGSVSMVKYVLQEGCSVLARDRFGNTPLTEAIRSKNLETIKLLRKAGGHLIADAKTLHAAVITAVDKDDKEALECYNAAGVDLKSTDDRGKTALHVAAFSNKPKCTKYLLDILDKVDQPDSYGFNPLQLAEKAGHGGLVAQIRKHKTVLKK